MRYAFFRHQLATIVIVAMLYAGVSGLCATMKYLGLATAQDRPDIYPVMFLFLISLLYGIGRIGATHPDSRPLYKKWLETTPWQFPSPLPLGPIHLVWLDVFLLGVISIVAVFQLHLSPFIFIAAFGWAYLAFLAISLHTTGQYSAAYVLWIGLSSCVLLENSARIALLLLALYPLAYVALQRSLADFPWPQPRPEIMPGHDSWQPSPANRDHRISTQRAILNSLLVGWSVYCSIQLAWSFFFFNLEVPELMRAQLKIDQTAALLPQLFVDLGIFGGICAGYRWVRYCIRYWPPISFFGRIATGRFVIPGYDRVFVAPLCSLLICILLPKFLYNAGLSIDVFAPVTVTLALISIRTIGPTLRDWELTGQHRIVTVFVNQMAISQNLYKSPPDLPHRTGTDTIASGLRTRE